MYMPPLYNHRVGVGGARMWELGIGGATCFKSGLEMSTRIYFKSPTIVVPRLDLNLVQILRHLLGGGGGVCQMLTSC